MPEPLKVMSAEPDPPFEDNATGTLVGFDPDMMRAVAAELGRPVTFARFDGADFDGIFGELDAGRADVVASGATITDHRQTLAQFCEPYVRSGQSMVVAPARNPDLRSVDDLGGHSIGVQHGNTSQPLVNRLLAEGRVARVQVYGYPDIRRALDDVEQGRLDAFMKLEPVMRWLIRDRPALRMVQAGITDELLSVAVRKDDTKLAKDINAALGPLRRDGTLVSLGRRWLGTNEPGNSTNVVA